jgi:methylated-DNA-[protein]-cysteine S-methyltransferase
MNDVGRELRRGFGQRAGTAAKTIEARAAEAGLLDVAYATVDSPLGPLVVAATPRGLVRLAYPDRAPDAVLEDLAARVSPRVLEAPGRLDGIRRELDEYFEGRRRGFEAPVDLSLVRGFTRRVLRAAVRIPYGRVSTYGQVAGRAGSPRASRAAGNALGSNPIPVVVPCHRVVHAGGGLGGYTGGLDRKRFLLELEGALGGGGLVYPAAP